MDNRSTGPQGLLFCHKCGAQLLPDSMFCDRCGAKVGVSFENAPEKKQTTNDTNTTFSAPTENQIPHDTNTTPLEIKENNDTDKSGIIIAGVVAALILFVTFALIITNEDNNDNKDYLGWDNEIAANTEKEETQTKAPTITTKAPTTTTKAPTTTTKAPTTTTKAPAVSSVPTTSSKPTETISIQFPQTPLYVNTIRFNMDTGKYGISHTVRIDSFSYEINSLGYLNLYCSGEKTFDIKGANSTHSCEMNWRLYDSEGYFIDSGWNAVSSLKVGEKFKNQKINVGLVNITEGESYILEMFDSSYE